MSNLKINIRILMWHIQVGYKWKCHITYNDYHKGLKHGLFAVYEFAPFKKVEKEVTTKPPQP